jgi:hypothetical protein
MIKANEKCLLIHRFTSELLYFARELVGLFQERYQSLANRFAPHEKLFGIDREKLTAPTEQAGAIS